MVSVLPGVIGRLSRCYKQPIRQALYLLVLEDRMVSNRCFNSLHRPSWHKVWQLLTLVYMYLASLCVYVGVGRLWRGGWKLMDVSFVPYFVMFRIRCSHTKVRKSVGEQWAEESIWFMPLIFTMYLILIGLWGQVIDIELLILSYWYWVIDIELLILSYWYWVIDIELLILSYWY